ncbi:MAG: hypothetical protein U0946_00480 [Patescibacteria group bacterium]|nr:hypothetical protein [Patescibacteria group bacterium]
MEINLFVKKIKQIREKQRIKKLSVRILLIIMIILALLMIVLSSAALKIANSNKELEKKIGLTKNKITQLEDVESKQVYLLSKLGSFANLLKLQERHQAVAETIFDLIPNGTTLQGFEVNEKGIIDLAGNVPDWLKLFELLKRIKESSTSQLRVVKADVNKIGFGSKGGINFNINIVLSGAPE